MKKKVSFNLNITGKILRDFTRLSGDKNKLHTSETYAKNVGFPSKVVHGAFIISQFSKLIGTKLPGHGSLILFSEYKFHYPAFINNLITIEGKVVSFSKSTSTYNIKLSAKYKKNDKLISTGNVVVRVK